VILQGWLEKVAQPPSNGIELQSLASPSPHWPVVVSAAVFALMHYSHGPDPIPLFLLAVGLGYLYRQTHRLLPSVTVHFLLNGMSMALLWMELTYGKK
jgi:membrane protease YdiL (CAAX protease family)